MRDSTTQGILLTHLISVVGEWALTIGVLVHAFAWRGPPAVGIVSLVLLIPTLLSASLVGAAHERWRTHAIRVASLGMQVVSFAAAAQARSRAPW